jgi:uracil-DNA glycosylase
MRINDNLHALLTWYRSIGITCSLSPQPRDYMVPLNPVIPMPPIKSKTTPKPIQQSSREIAQSCQSLAELRQALQNFEGCALKHTATNLVFADGNPQAKVMVVGEAPGADEDRQGLPFVGLSGQLLDRILATIGLNRTNVYISNIVPWRPPGNRQPTTQEIALCQPFIERHIELVNPQLLILVGGVSAKTLLQTNEGIVKLRGRWQSYQSAGLMAPIKALATFHPAYLLRSPGQKAQVWKDMMLIQDTLRSSQS